MAQILPPKYNPGATWGQALSQGLTNVSNKGNIAQLLKAHNLPEEAAQLPHDLLIPYLTQNLKNEGSMRKAGLMGYGAPSGQQVQGSPGQPDQGGMQQQYQQRPALAGKLTAEQSQDLEKYQNYVEQEKLVRELDKLYKSGNVPSGRFGRSLEVFTGPQSGGQDFERYTKKLVGLKLAALGNPTNAKLEFLEDTKPNLSMNKDVQGNAIKSEMREAAQGKREAFARLPAWKQEELRRIGQAPMEQVRNERASGEQRAQKEQEANPANKPESEGWGEWVVRNIKRATPKPFGNLLDPLDEKEYREYRAWSKKNGMSEEELQTADRKRAESLQEHNENVPKNYSEEVFDNLVSGLPLMVVGGPMTATKFGAHLLKDLAGTAAAVGVRRGGGGPVAQVVAGIAGGMGAQKLGTAFKRGVKISRLKDAAQVVQQKYYNAADKMGKVINEPATHYGKKLNSLEKVIGETISVDSNQKQQLLNKITELKGDIVNNKINGADILKRKREVYGTYGDFDKAGKDYISKMFHIISEQADEMGKRNTTWNTIRKSGDDIHKALKWKETLYRKLDLNPELAKKVTAKTAAAILGLGGGSAVAAIGGAPAAAKAAAITGAANKLGRVAAFALSTNPRVQKLAHDALKDVMDGSAKQTALAFNRLSQATKKYDVLLDDEDFGLEE